MNNEKETISKEEAAATLKSVDLTKRDAIKSFRIPLLLITLISLSYSLIVFSWGMTEGENMWALGMYIGAASFGIFVALYLYTFRLLGIKVSVLPRTKERIKSELVLLVIFCGNSFCRKTISIDRIRICTSRSRIDCRWLYGLSVIKYPTGEYLTRIKYND